jgi:hypothetical protein
VDPLSNSYPWNSVYAFAENKPIWAIDLDGLEKVIYNRSIWFGDLISGYTGCQDGAYLNEDQWKALEPKLMSVHNSHFTQSELNYLKKKTGYSFDKNHPSRIQFDYTENSAIHEIHIYGCVSSPYFRAIQKYRKSTDFLHWRLII